MNSLFLVSSNIEQFNINTLTFLLVIIGLTLLKVKEYDSEMGSVRIEKSGWQKHCS